MKIGVIGLGDIALKAYLPVISGIENIEFHLYTRNEAKLAQVAQKYRFQKIHHNLDSLINSGIKGAFVHTATESHYEIVKQLLLNNIHVYVDKPLSYHYEQSQELVQLAEKKQLKLMVGFNRRYAPSYQKLKELADPNMIIMQKNRKSLPGDVQTFILDDFIHVVDTLRYLFPNPIDQIVVNGKKKGEVLYHVSIQIISTDGTTAIGIMNRDSGVNEEKVEVMSAAEKRVVYNVSELIIQKDRDETKQGSSDWEPALHKRGFEQIIADFIQSITLNIETQISSDDALKTHEICDVVIKKLLEMNK